jgi:hypothetical protein
MIPYLNPTKQAVNPVAPPANSIFVITPYVYQGAWVFNDPSVGLEREPFVYGMDLMLDHMVEDWQEEAWKGFRLYFSRTETPKSEYHLKAMQPEEGGMWYREVNTRMGGWLCPATLLYFGEFPEELFVWAERITR